MYKVTISGLPADSKIQIDGIGLLGNGVHSIDKNQADMFRMRNKHINRDNPTLLQAFKNHPNVSVESTQTEQATQAQKPADQKKEGDK